MQDVNMSHVDCTQNCGNGHPDCCQKPCLTQGCDVFSITVEVWGDTFPAPLTTPYGRLNTIDSGMYSWLPAYSAANPLSVHYMCNPNLPNTPPFSPYAYRGVGGDCGWHNLNLHFPPGSHAYNLTLYFAAKSANDWPNKPLYFDSCLRWPISTYPPRWAYMTNPPPDPNFRRLRAGGLYRIAGTNTWVSAGSSPHHGRGSCADRLSLPLGGPPTTSYPAQGNDCICRRNGGIKDGGNTPGFLDRTPTTTAAFHFLTSALPNTAQNSSGSSGSSNPSRSSTSTPSSSSTSQTPPPSSSSSTTPPVGSSGSSDTSQSSSSVSTCCVPTATWTLGQNYATGTIVKHTI